MAAPKWILMGTLTLFSIIGVAAIVKKKDNRTQATNVTLNAVAQTPVISVPVAPKPFVIEPVVDKKRDSKRKKGKNASNQDKRKEAQVIPTSQPLAQSKDDFPNIDRIFQLFTTGTSKLPIVETIDYSSSVPWLKGRPAWIADYASHYNTSRHFIARSLNGRVDYFTQKVSEGSKFNVFRKDRKINFQLLVDVTRCKMGFYYVDLETNERVLLKTYRVGLGRVDPVASSGTLTPLGRYTLGSRVAIYQPGMMGFHQDQNVEMIRVFGTRWIPMEGTGNTPVPMKGYGLQGAPWVLDTATGQLVENLEGIGTYDSDGCIRLSANDIEELYAIVLTKPTFIEIVKDFHEVKLPGVEVAAPSR